MRALCALASSLSSNKLTVRLRLVFMVDDTHVPIVTVPSRETRLDWVRLETFDFDRVSLVSMSSAPPHRWTLGGRLSCNQAFALSLFACHLPRPADCLALLAGLSL